MKLYVSEESSHKGSYENSTLGKKKTNPELVMGSHLEQQRYSLKNDNVFAQREHDSHRRRVRTALDVERRAVAEQGKAFQEDVQRIKHVAQDGAEQEIIPPWLAKWLRLCGGAVALRLVFLVLVFVKRKIAT